MFIVFSNLIFAALCRGTQVVNSQLREGNEAMANRPISFTISKLKIYLCQIILLLLFLF